MSPLQILTVRQQQELNKAILQYLKPILTENTGNVNLTIALSNILQTPLSSIDDNNNNIIPNYLEKKWSTVLRLQKKIIDLENEISNYKAIIDASNTTDALSKHTSLLTKDKINWLPNNAIKTFKTQAQQLIQSVTIHPFLPIIHSGCSDGSLISWNLVNDDTLIPEKFIKAHTRAINKIRWSNAPLDLSAGKSLIPDKNKSYILATCSADLSIKIWDGATYKQIRTLSGHEHTVSSIAFSKSTPHILYSVSRDKTVKIWDLTSGFCIKSFVGHSDWVRDIDVISVNSQLLMTNIKESSEIGDFIVTCSNDQSVRLSHADSGTGISLLIGHTHVIETVKFLPLHSNYFIDKYLTNNSDKFPNISPSFFSDPVYTQTLGFKYCISAGRDNLIKLWLLPPPVLRPHRHPLPSQQNNSQGWLIAELVGHQSWVKALSIHPNGRFIFSGSDDKTIRVWDLDNLNQTGNVKCIRTLTGHDGFINDLNFASFEIESDINSKKKQDVVINPKKEDGSDKSTEQLHKELMKFIESKMRCLFLSGGVDNAVKLWS
ncbi:dynein regulator [Hyphopichia burtonii NRRL Y-1933]|uniref:Nuclear distribution protein PAC1 n=1 Tax=Hyphopichia burtonii NRRL Y-1933 TaxID=984485 RepID=A0A1E4RSM0_9ASCO|nr:dynein regulator [Hyphopichia burtonii NRRL Y-1933]ODV70246.1 dynein regulator [Hyphopichia burtonii NRRL Y-1933]